jgi:hypothetical protein
VRQIRGRRAPRGRARYETLIGRWSSPGGSGFRQIHSLGQADLQVELWLVRAADDAVDLVIRNRAFQLDRDLLLGLAEYRPRRAVVVDRQPGFDLVPRLAVGAARVLTVVAADDPAALDEIRSGYTPYSRSRSSALDHPNQIGRPAADHATAW